MEEKTVKMEVQKNEQRDSKLNYEQLENIAKQLTIQNKQLLQQVNNLNTSYIFTVLEFMLKIAEIGNKENSKYSFDDEFMSYVYKEIQRKIYELTSPKEIEEENKNADN